MSEVKEVSVSLGTREGYRGAEQGDLESAVYPKGRN